MPIIILISIIFFLILLVILLVIQCSVLTNQNIYLEKKLILTEGRLDLLEANFVLFKEKQQVLVSEMMPGLVSSTDSIVLNYSTLSGIALFVVCSLAFFCYLNYASNSHTGPFGGPDFPSSFSSSDTFDTLSLVSKLESYSIVDSSLLKEPSRVFLLNSDRLISDEVIDVVKNFKTTEIYSFHDFDFLSQYNTNVSQTTVDLIARSSELFASSF